MYFFVVNLSNFITTLSIWIEKHMRRQQMKRFKLEDNMGGNNRSLFMFVTIWYSFHRGIKHYRRALVFFPQLFQFMLFAFIHLIYNFTFTHFILSSSAVRLVRARIKVLRWFSIKWVFFSLSLHLFAVLYLLNDLIEYGLALYGTHVATGDVNTMNTVAYAKLLSCAMLKS